MDNRKTSANSQKSSQNMKESYSGVNTGTEGDDDLIDLGKEEWN